MFIQFPILLEFHGDLTVQDVTLEWFMYCTALYILTPIHCTCGRNPQTKPYLVSIVLNFYMYNQPVFCDA